jgi:hypothetical protein
MNQESLSNEAAGIFELKLKKMPRQPGVLHTTSGTPYVKIVLY